MPSRLLPGRDEPDLHQQQLPFTGGHGSTTTHTHTHDDDGGSLLADTYSQAENGGAQTVPRSRSTRAYSIASQTLSSSYSRNPVRSFAHQTWHGAADTPQYSSQGVRERSSQLASYALDSDAYQDRPPRHSFADADSDSAVWTDTIDEDSEAEAETPETVIGPVDTSAYPWAGRRDAAAHTPISAPSRVPDVVVHHARDQHHHHHHHQHHHQHHSDERTPLLPTPRLSRLDSPRPKQAISHPSSSSSSPPTRSPLFPSLKLFHQTWAIGKERVLNLRLSFANPQNYTKDALLTAALGSLQTLSAVFLGLLLNLLDALSYGYILFPLGAPIFSQTGPDGISIFFVSCIVAQLCYSFGLSTFRGGVGSEMIEVVPFFHKMAYSIMEQMEGQPPEAIIATTIVSYCLSSILTGVIFLALGSFKLGNLVSFFPRHILIGCIGGVGFFLIVTGFEVSARLEGNLNYDLDTLHKLFSADTWYLWALPLFLANAIMLLQRMVKSPFVLPVFFVMIFAAFYIIVKGIFRIDLEVVRNAGWIFEQPESGVQFYRFYTYFSKSTICSGKKEKNLGKKNFAFELFALTPIPIEFGSIDVSALLSTIPTMFALSFFGIIHVPINVPALGAAVKEDNLDVNRELIAHGVSNTLSGLVGSIQVCVFCLSTLKTIINGD